MLVSRILEHLARFSARNRWAVIAGWLVAAVGLTVIVLMVDIDEASELRVENTDSQDAVDLLEQRFPEFGGISAQVVFHDPDGIVRHRQAIGTTLVAAAALTDVVSVSDPFAEDTVSADGTTTVATVRYAKPQADLPSSTYRSLVAATAPVGDESYRVEVGGALGFFDETGSSSAEYLGAAAAVVILLLAFRSVVAMAIPLVSAVVGLGVGLALIDLLALRVDMPASARTLATMIGIGVGVDYALFIVTRHREMLERYRWVQNALGYAASTAGKAVVFAGVTVVISILGLAISGVAFIGWMGVAAALVVLVMVAASATLVPALLDVSGRDIDRLSISEPVERRDVESTVWARWGRRVAAHPVPYLCAGTIVLVALSLPVLDMRLGQSDAGSLPPSSSHRQAYDLVSAAYGPGANGPLLVVVDLAGGGDLGTVEADRASVLARDDVSEVSAVQVNAGGDTAVYSVIPASAPDSVETEELVEQLRRDVLPAGVERTGASAYVTGPTANFIDLADRIADRLLVFILAILALSFLVLVVLFRSLLVPLKAAVLNLFSVGAAYGVIVAVFQWGWGLELVGLEEPIPIMSVIPMLMFAILFGLSMDYEVFLLSRVREEFERSGDNTASVIRGIASTGRIITSAAAIMVAVFFGFVIADDPLVKMAGLGLGTAILVDATVVRMVLVPSTMQLMGDWNWWRPRWLDQVLPGAPTDRTR